MSNSYAKTMKLHNETYNC